jgi:hypothetical protein
MRTLKKGALFAVTVGVWTAALGSAAALTYDLNRPLHAFGSASEVAPPPGAGANADADLVLKTHATLAPRTEASPVLHIPTITIVARRVDAPRSRAPRHAGLCATHLRLSRLSTCS